MSTHTSASTFQPPTRTGRAQWSAWRLLELLAVLVLGISVIGLLCMRLGVFHAWQIWIMGFLATFAYAKLVPSERSLSENGPPIWHLFLVIAIALLFRLPGYDYQLGGQDQGIYTNMAAYLARTGGLKPIDMVFQGIANPDVRELYLKSNYQGPHYLLGIYGLGDGKLEFQFYHLFPVWLAMFGTILGEDNLVYALTFLSIVSILFFQRLAHAITGSAGAGLVAGVLLAVNPLHAFFSKFPVTEIPTLAFSLICFNFLLAYWKRAEAGGWRYLVISLVALMMLFMTRISGFMYLPLILAISLCSFLMGQENEKKKGFLLWSILATLLYALSVAYGLKWSATYAKDIYGLSFAPLLGERWPEFVLAATACAMAGWMAIGVLARRKTGRAMLLKAAGGLRFFLPLLILLFSLFAAWKAYKLGFTTAYSEHHWYGKVFGLANQGMKSIRSTSLVAAIVYLSPFLMLAFYAVLLRKQANATVTLILLFITCFYGYLAALQWILPYQPYYARYLVSEFVPYLLLFVVCTWAFAERGAVKRYTLMALVASGVWATVLSAQQIGKTEHEGVGPSIKRLVSHFDPRDLILIDKSMVGPTTHELKTSLVYTYGMNVATVTPNDIGDAAYVRRLGMPYHDVFYVGRSSTPPAGFVEVDAVDFLERGFCHGVSAPTKMCTRSDGQLMIYRRPRWQPPSPGEMAMEFSAMDSEIKTLVGRKEHRSLVADGRPGFVMYGPYRPLAAGKYSITVKGSSSTPFTLDMSANQGKQVAHRTQYPAAQDGKSGILAQFDFEQSESVEDLEVRILVPATSDIRIESYQILHR